MIEHVCVMFVCLCMFAYGGVCVCMVACFVACVVVCVVVCLCMACVVASGCVCLCMLVYAWLGL